jgi:hypothetical protein
MRQPPLYEGIGIFSKAAAVGLLFFINELSIIASIATNAWVDVTHTNDVVDLINRLIMTTKLTKRPP